MSQVPKALFRQLRLDRPDIGRWRLEAPRACFREACHLAHHDPFPIPLLGWLGLHADLSVDELLEGLARVRVHPLSVAIAEADPAATGRDRRKTIDPMVVERLGLPAHLVEGFQGPGELRFGGIRARELPPNLVAMKVSVEGLNSLAAWPEGWAVGRLFVTYCSKLNGLGPFRRLHELKVWGCKELRWLDLGDPDSVDWEEAMGHFHSLELGYCPNLEALPDPLLVGTPGSWGSQIELSHLEGMRGLPQELESDRLTVKALGRWEAQDVTGWNVKRIALANCADLASMTGHLQAYSLSVEDCRVLATLPERMGPKVGDIELTGLPALRFEGGEDWTVNTLEFRSTPQVRALPAKVVVTGLLVPHEALEPRLAHEAARRGGGRLAGWFDLEPAQACPAGVPDWSFKEEEVEEMRMLLAILPDPKDALKAFEGHGRSAVECLALLAEVAPIGQPWLLAALRHAGTEADLVPLLGLLAHHQVHPATLLMAQGAYSHATTNKGTRHPVGHARSADPVPEREWLGFQLSGRPPFRFESHWVTRWIK